MAQNENYSQVDLRVGTEEQFNAKVGTLPAGALFGVTDSTVSKADLSTDLKNEINGKYTKPSDGIPKSDLASGVQTSLGKADTALQSHQTVKLESGTNNGTLKLIVNGTATDNVAVTNLGSAAFTATSNYATAAQGAKADSAIQKPSNPTAESAITINSSGTISTKPLASITGKTEVAVSSIRPNDDSSEVLWINPDGNSKYESLIDSKYTKPEGGIPKSHLSSEVQASLDKADTALQSHQTITTGSVNGTISVGGTNVSVKGLGSLAYKNALTKSDVGLGNVDNTSDEAKPISAATQTALNGKVNTTTTVNGHALSSNITITKSDIGLGSVINAGQDSTPTANSSNYITSGGVKSYVDTATSILRAYPVGAIYISVKSTPPGELFGGGWTQLKDRFLLAAGSGYAAGTTGGESVHRLTLDEIPAHNHTLRIVGNGEVHRNIPATNTSWGYYQNIGDGIDTAGGGQTHNNMPPYLTVYMWKRIS